MIFDRETFYTRFRAHFGSLTKQQVRALNFLLECIENDPYVRRLEWAAYMLATTMHETASTFLPIHEYGSHAYFVGRYGGQTRKGRELGNDTPEEGYDYAGKGFPQVTGESNYEKAEEALRSEYPALVADFERRTGKRFDLTVGDQPDDKADPQNLLDPKIAYAVMSFGMRTGMFTGHYLLQYLSSQKKDYLNARRIINGTDKADLIARYARAFDEILTEARVVVVQVPAPIPAAAAPAASPSVIPPLAPADDGAFPLSDTRADVNEPVGDSSPIPPDDSAAALPPEQLNVEDYKPFVKRWLSRIWGAFTGGNLTQSFAMTAAAVRDSDHWHIYAGIAALIFVVTFVFVLLGSIALGVILWHNRREIAGYIRFSKQTLIDPNVRNLCLNFEKK